MSEQADVFSFGVIMYEIFVGAITSQLVVGPTGNTKAAELYAAKVPPSALPFTPFEVPASYISYSLLLSREVLAMGAGRLREPWGT